MVCTVITVSISLYLPYIMRQAIDGLMDQTLTRAGLARWLLLYAGLALICVFFSRYLRKLPMRLSHKVEYALRNDLFDHLTGLDQAFFQKERTGDLITRMTSDMKIVRDSVGQGLLQGIRTTCVFVFASVVMLMTDARLALLVLGLYLPMTFFFFLVLKAIRSRQKALQEQVSEVSSFCQESLAGIRCIKGFALEQRRVGLFEFLNKDLIKHNLQVQAIRQTIWPFMSLWFCLSVILILNVGGRQVVRGERSIGTLVQFMQYLLYMQWPLLALSWITSLMQRGKVSWQRIKDIFEHEPAIRDTEHTDIGIGDLCGDIRFQGCCLDIDERRLLHHLNLTIRTGQTVGITGPTGSGKTLLASLVVRLLDPTEGTVRIGEHDIKAIPLDRLRQHIGFAAQEPVLFSRTLEHNIGFGAENADAELIEWSAEVAHLKDDIDTFPDGFETQLGERGVTLSGGQRQRTAISRAIARRPDILILDDVLSAVDTQTEAAIIRKLQPVMKKRTTLLISHRISTLRYTDTVVVIEEGRITQQGTHDELIIRSGYYSELNRIQKIKQELEGQA